MKAHFLYASLRRIGSTYKENAMLSNSIYPELPPRPGAPVVKQVVCDSPNGDCLATGFALDLGSKPTIYNTVVPPSEGWAIVPNGYRCEECVAKFGTGPKIRKSIFS